jgi:hypothetical protein
MKQDDQSSEESSNEWGTGGKRSGSFRPCRLTENVAACPAKKPGEDAASEEGTGDEDWVSEGQREHDEQEDLQVAESEIMRFNDMGYMEVLVWIHKDVEKEEVKELTTMYLQRNGYGTVYELVKGEKMKREGKECLEWAFLISMDLEQMLYFNCLDLLLSMTKDIYL